MLSPSPLMNFSEYSQYTVWLITMAIVAFGFRGIKGIIAFVLDKMYQFFIQKKPTAI